MYSKTFDSLLRERDCVKSCRAHLPAVQLSMRTVAVQDCQLVSNAFILTS